MISLKPKRRVTGQAISMCGEDPNRWNAIEWSIANKRHGGVIYSSGWTKFCNLKAPFTSKENNAIISKSKRKRPGPTYWKVAFVPLFQEWVQEAYWDFIDTQRACSVVAENIRKATQVNLDKTSDGVRPLTMLEESRTAIEGPVASITNQACNGRWVPYTHPRQFQAKQNTELQDK